jgi:AcrR family transcriptional regulator
MEVFWAHGYEGTSIAQLQHAMGDITPPSFYAAFGSKEQLFKEALDFYAETVGAPAVHALLSGTTARASFEALLRIAASSFTQPGKPHGCMHVLGAVNCSPQNKKIQDHLVKFRTLRAKYLGDRLRRGVKDGDLSKTADIPAMVVFYSTFLNGLAIQARDGSSRDELNAAIDGAMAAWKQFLAPRTKRPGRTR